MLTLGVIINWVFYWPNIQFQANWCPGEILNDIMHSSSVLAPFVGVGVWLFNAGYANVNDYMYRIFIHPATNSHDLHVHCCLMMTSSNGNISALLALVRGIHRWIPHTKASDAEFWCFPWSREILYTAGQRCTQPCIVNTHIRAWLPGCVLKMAAWQGFACSDFTDTSGNTRAEATFIITHHFLCITVVHAFQGACDFAQNISSTIQNNIAGLCAIGRAVCFKHGCVQFRRAVRLVYN